MRLIIEASSDKNDTIWEPFGGLCSAAVAAHQLGRRCYAAEKEKCFFDVAVKRLKAICSQGILNA
jgi:site-specific DNA-methyltransferase (adenine-specific)